MNKQRDIVFDGTMTWAPFVEQTIAMVRDHQHNYRRGPGYFTNEDGNTVERCAVLREHGFPCKAYALLHASSDKYVLSWDSCRSIAQLFCLPPSHYSRWALE